MAKIYYTKPSITDLEVEFATDAARNGWGENCYEYIRRFEEGYARFLGVDHAVATSSCTGAMHLGLAGLGVGPGDEIILADSNWVATVSPVVHLGARPVFVDILPDTWCIDPAGAEAAITPNTRAIIATHLYGNLCDMNALNRLSDKYGVAIIEDAAEAIGSVYDGKPAGSIGLFSTFSFHGSKTVTTGEGGLFATRDRDLHERVLTLSNHGRSRSETRQFWAESIGYKFKMSNIEAAIGCAQLERIDDLIRRKREILDFYNSRLGDLSGLHMNPEPPGTVNGGWMPTVVFDESLGITREDLLAAFSGAEIDARVFFWPLSSLDAFQSVPRNRHAWDICGRAINLPSYHDITEIELLRVVSVIRRLVAGSS